MINPAEDSLALVMSLARDMLISFLCSCNRSALNIRVADTVLITFPGLLGETLNDY